MDSLIGSTLASNHGNVPSSTINQARYVLFYFSAHWCPPCRAFTPKLALFYEAANASQKQVEIIFVSADRDPAQFHEYFQTMPWLSIPYENQGVRNSLSQKYGIQGIPALILVDRQGNM